jgi:hypothetical protein
MRGTIGFHMCGVCRVIGTIGYSSAKGEGAKEQENAKNNFHAIFLY